MVVGEKMYYDNQEIIHMIVWSYIFLVPIFGVFGGFKLINRKFTLIMCFLAVFGGWFAMIGYYTGLRGCDDDSFFEVIGVLMFLISFLGVPFNVFWWLSSIPNVEIDSWDLFRMVLLHAVVIFLTLVLFEDGLVDDFFCGGSGPH
ncbi:MAG: hypothetical protein CMB48_00465, partial [Euryarchaeota archaeon]|nr:hypothetical protein [Euryarchaeota archaeon]